MSVIWLWWIGVVLITGIVQFAVCTGMYEYRPSEVVITTVFALLMGAIGHWAILADKT